MKSAFSSGVIVLKNFPAYPVMTSISFSFSRFDFLQPRKMTRIQWKSEAVCSNFLLALKEPSAFGIRLAETRFLNFGVGDSFILPLPLTLARLVSSS